MLFNLLLANITTLLCFFFLFRVVFNNFFTIHVVTENEKLKLAPAIPTGAPITVANDAIEMLSLVADKTVKIYQNSQRKQYTYEAFYLLIIFL